MKIIEADLAYLFQASLCNIMYLQAYPNGTLDHDLFYSLIFTQRASRRLPSAALLRARNSQTMASLSNALHMKASDSCKIQFLNKRLGNSTIDLD